ncbi:MAG: leucyl aminopeptidase [Deinococcales bacterium]|nr:leucyl aminopeptidase [Deinococcales bacterium]
MQNDPHRTQSTTPATGLPGLVASAAVPGDIKQADADTLVVNLFQGVSEPSGATGAVDAALGGAITDLIAGGDLSGRLGEVAVLYPAGKLPARRVLVAGLGPFDAFGLEAIRRASANAALRARELGAKRVATIVHGAGIGGVPATEAAQATLEGALLATYRFGGWRKGAGEAPQLESITLVEHDDAKLASVEEGARAARAVARGVALARDLVNLPPNVVDPDHLVATARQLAADTGLRFRVGDRAWAEREGMGALLAVAQGTRKEPYVIELEHNAGRDDLPLVALVGKGVTFDTGGLSLKTRDGMIPMKADMAGAAAVLGTMQAVAELDLPVRVLAVCACVENMPDGNAYRPSDVLVAGNGLSIEVLSTDAEGRLALADALWYVQRFAPKAVLDIATLTGASMAAMGRGVAGSLFANDAALRARVETASQATGERVWAMPLFDEYREAIESKVADLKNTGGAGGGVGTSAVFLEAFTDYPWAHVDMAGMELIDSAKGRNYLTHGATGYGVRLFVEFLRDWA